ncbi:MAG: 2-hydroxyacyl-CoA dehydratase family protein [Firmicutes bacterium]|nr:2-hydroxyacyl-CoA dehydratase [Alicyclobacillaceae bacterium]MCL6498292.1 2-hydroxyacyl-CoA dehydratase family protein [Bacillota bacterium]
MARAVARHAVMGWGQAEMDAAFTEMEQAYCHPLQVAQAWKREGKPVVACIGLDIPEEVIDAVGALPVQVRGIPVTPQMATFLDVGWPEGDQELFAAVVSGAYGFCDLMVISRLQETYPKLYGYLTELRRHGNRTGSGIPPLFLYDRLPGNVGPAAAAFNRVVMDRLVESLQSIGRCGLSAARLSASTRQAVRIDGLTLALARLRQRHPPQVSGYEALVVTGARWAMSRSRYVALLERFVEARREAPGRPCRARIFLIGNTSRAVEVYRAVEAAEAVVVGEVPDYGVRVWEDDDLGSPAPSEDLEGVLEAITRRYQRLGPWSSWSDLGVRVAWLTRRIKESRPDGVIVIEERYREPDGWELPSLQAVLKNLGIPWRTIGLEFRPAGSEPEWSAMAHAVSEFVRAISR